MSYILNLGAISEKVVEGRRLFKKGYTKFFGHFVVQLHVISSDPIANFVQPDLEMTYVGYGGKFKGRAIIHIFINWCFCSQIVNHD